MSILVSQPAETEASARRIHDVRRFERVVAGAVLVLSAGCLTASRFFTPEGLETREILDAVAEHPGRQLEYALLTYIAGITMVPAVLAAARLARTQRPMLAMIAAGINLVSYLGGATLAVVEVMYLAGAQLPIDQRGAAAALIDGFWSAGLVSFSAWLFTFGSLAGGVLLGLALRGRIPAVGWLAVAVSQPLLFLQWAVLPSNGSSIGLDAAARAVLALGFACCAYAVLRTPNDDWDLPPHQAIRN
jgi:hypothetical protein